jgi:hypothetical protein
MTELRDEMFIGAAEKAVPGRKGILPMRTGWKR